MTNYNDGYWHGWNGGECPVHPKTLVDVCDLVVAPRRRVIAETEVFWPNAVAFRVVKEYREPRECWSYGAHLHDTEADAIAFRKAVADGHPGKGYENGHITKWREVTE